MGKTAQRSLQPAQDNRAAGISLLGQEAVNGSGTVGPLPCPVTGAVGIIRPLALGGGVVRHHRVDIAPGDEEPQPRAAKALKIPGIIKGGLRQYSHPVTGGLQLAGYDGNTKAGVVYIGVAGDADKIHLIPAPLIKFFFCNG